MNDFTKGVLRFLLTEGQGVPASIGTAAMREACLQWLEESGGDRSEAAIGFARQLSDDVQELFTNCRPTTPEQEMALAFLKAGFDRVCWSRVAAELLERLVPPRMRPLVTASVN